jgi:hypothetical protein
LDRGQGRTSPGDDFVHVEVRGEDPTLLPGEHLHFTSAAERPVRQSHSVPAQRRPVGKSARATEGQGGRQLIGVHAYPIISDEQLNGVFFILASYHINGDRPGSSLERVVDEFRNRVRCVLVSTVSRRKDEVPGTDQRWLQRGRSLAG